MFQQTKSFVVTVLVALPIGVLLYGLGRRDVATVRVWVEEPGVEVVVGGHRVRPEGPGGVGPVGPFEVFAGRSVVELVRDDDVVFSQSLFLEPGESREFRPRVRRPKDEAAVTPSLGPVMELASERSLVGHRKVVTGIGFLSDGRALSLGHDRLLNLWDVDHGRADRSVEVHAGEFESMAVFNQGRGVLAVDDAGLLSIRDAATTDVIRELFVTRIGRILCAAITPTGSLVAVGGADGLVQIHRVDDGTVVSEHPLAPAVPSSLGFSPDGRTLLIGLSGSPRTADAILVVDVEKGQVERRLIGHAGPVSAVAFLPGGRVASTGNDGTLRVWELASGRQIRQCVDRSGTGAGLCLSVSADGRFAVVGTGHAWDAYDGWTPAGSYGAEIWDLETGGLVGRFPTEGPVRCLALSADARQVLTGGDDALVRQWLLPSREVLVQLSERRTELAQETPADPGMTVKKAAVKGLDMPIPKGA